MMKIQSSVARSFIFLCCLFHQSNNQMIGFISNPFPMSPIESAIQSRALNRMDRAMNRELDGQVGDRKSVVQASSLESVLIRCKQDSDCIDDNSPGNPENLMYCDRHYGFCDYFRQVGELCRHDSQCDSGLICMFGKCAMPVEPGQTGARCTDASDCAPGHCCARQHGELICKLKLKLGQQCFVPLGGLEFSLNQICPCDEGLDCQQVKAKSKRKRHFKSDNVLRCTLNKSPS